MEQIISLQENYGERFEENQFVFQEILLFILPTLRGGREVRGRYLDITADASPFLFSWVESEGLI